MPILLPIAAALLGAFIFHRQSILSALDRVQADSGDSTFIAFVLEHWRNAFHGQIGWRSPPVFWPLPNTLAYSDLLVGMGAIHAALRTVLDVFPAMNLQLVLLSLATFATSYLLFVRGLRLSVWGATAGAYFVAFSWPRYAQLVHVQLQFTALTPLLTLLALECLRDGRTMRRAAFAWRACAFAALLVLLLATALYYAVFFALGLTVALLLCLLHGRARHALRATIGRQALPLAAAAALGILLSIPIIHLYLPVWRTSHGRAWSEVAQFIPTPTQLLWMGEENFAWGWLFAHWPRQTILDRWAELRIGVGLVASLAWAAAVLWSLHTVLRNWRTLDRRTAAIPLIIITGFALQLLMLRWPYRSAWWFVWKAFPGAAGIRGVARLELLVTLPMGLAFAALIDRAARLPARARTAAAILALAAAAEQAGTGLDYSGRAAEALARTIADAIPAGCRAAYIVAPPDLFPAPGPLDPAHFDAGAYLAANPDVAANWTGTAWEHYEKFGRDENRALDPSTVRLRVALLYFGYNDLIPLAADLRLVPVANGLSGWSPPGWDLFNVLSPAAPEHLAAWLRLNHEPPGAACLVPVRVTVPMIPGLPDSLRP